MTIVGAAVLASVGGVLVLSGWWLASHEAARIDARLMEVRRELVRLRNEVTEARLAADETVLRTESIEQKLAERSPGGGPFR